MQTFSLLVSRYWRLVLVVGTLGIALVFFSESVTERLRWETYTSSMPPFFSVRYLKDSVVTENYLDALIPPGTHPVLGVKFELPRQYSGGSQEVNGYFLVEHTDAASCGARSFMPLATSTSVFKERGITYETTSLSYGDTRRRSSEEVFAVIGSQPCVALLYVIQSNNVTAATAGAPSTQPKGVDKNTAYNILVSMRQSFVLNKK